ncbi:MAG TPA: Fic family protein [Gammaproteobacteria bacterium]|nr:Fic family protein [Gammaproteobacteria bacterium]
MYIYQKPSWPRFTWDNEKVHQALQPVKFQQGRLLGKMENLGFRLQEEALLKTLTDEAIKTSEIEGEVLNRDDVRSSIARHLGMDIAGLLPVSRHAEGIVEVLLDATRHYAKPLTEKRLCHWHATLFPTGMSGMMLVNPGFWRSDSEGPMQVISGSYGRQKVHFQAPPAKKLPKEIKLFLEWFNQPKTNMDLIIKAAIAHLWFVTLHPFDDGNGRITRAITDMVLAQAENQPNRYYSMSTQITKERKAYYEELERAQKGPLDITRWILWFLQCLHQAILKSESLLETVLNKAKFWERHSKNILNKRQVTMLNILFDGFSGNLTSSKWAKMMKCSQDTAARDINNLIEQEILVKSPKGGRSTDFLLKDFPIKSTD